ncbi:MAG: SpoVG family protein [Gemmatimonadetes bacterium]|nr:SpoVG family protein [Gemmatimonadota bacterium]
MSQVSTPRTYVTVITEVRVRLRRGRGGPDILRGFATITINGCFAIHNMKIIYGEERGLFVSMPAVQRNGRYQDIAHPITPEFRDEMEKAVIAEYEAELARNGGGD